MENEKRMAGEYEIIHAVQIGDREIVVGENPADTNGRQHSVRLWLSTGLIVL